MNYFQRNIMIVVCRSRFSKLTYIKFVFDLNLIGLLFEQICLMKYYTRISVCTILFVLHTSLKPIYRFLIYVRVFNLNKRQRRNI